MNGGALPTLLLGAALALMLSYAARRATIVGLGACTIVAIMVFLVPRGLAPKLVFVGLWLSVIVTAAMAYVPNSLRVKLTVPLSFNVGFWIGAYAGTEGPARNLLAGLAVALAVLPAKWLIVRKFDMIIKVVASWLIAISSLSIFVSLMPTPGYKPDHME